MAVEGTYNCTINSPMGAQNGTLTISSEGDSVSGSISGPNGTLNLDNCSIDGTSFSASAKMKQPMPIDLTFNLKIEGDSVSGSVQLGSFGSASVTGSRT